MRRLLSLALILVLALAGCAAPRSHLSIAPASLEPLAQPKTAAEAQPAKVSLNLYFPDNKGEKLVVEKRELSQPGPVSPQQIVDQLISGPVTSSTAVSLIPKETTAKVSQSEDLVTVDFSSEIRKVNVGSSGESLLINSLLACLFEMPTIQRVQILIDGKTADSLAGHIEIVKPFSRRAK